MEVYCTQNTFKEYIGELANAVKLVLELDNYPVGTDNIFNFMQENKIKIKIEEIAMDMACIPDTLQDAEPWTSVYTLKLSTSRGN